MDRDYCCDLDHTALQLLRAEKYCSGVGTTSSPWIASLAIDCLQCHDYKCIAQETTDPAEVGIRSDAACTLSSRPRSANHDQPCPATHARVTHLGSQVVVDVSLAKLERDQ